MNGQVHSKKKETAWRQLADSLSELELFAKQVLISSLETSSSIKSTGCGPPRGEALAVDLQLHFNHCYI